MSEIEICLIFLLYKIKIALPKDKVCHFLTDLELTDYFSASSAIPKLIDSELIRSQILGGEEFLIITNKGRETFDLNKSLLPKSAEEKIYSAAISYLKGEYGLTKIFTKVTPLREDCYLFQAGALDGDELIFEIKLRAKDKDELEKFEKNFRLNWSEIHQKFYQILKS